MKPINIPCGQNAQLSDLKVRAFWDIATCSFVVVYRRFRGAYCFYHQSDKFTALMMEAVCTSEMSIY
jgi:hypothetical protein